MYSYLVCYLSVVTKKVDYCWDASQLFVNLDANIRSFRTVESDILTMKQAVDLKPYDYMSHLSINAFLETK